jgi:hypothetical protein
MEKKHEKVSVIGAFLPDLGLRRVSPQISADARQPWIHRMNEIRRVSTDFRLVLPDG